VPPPAPLDRRMLPSRPRRRYHARNGGPTSTPRGPQLHRGGPHRPWAMARGGHAPAEAFPRRCLALFKASVPTFFCECGELVVRVRLGGSGRVSSTLERLNRFCHTLDNFHFVPILLGCSFSSCKGFVLCKGFLLVTGVSRGNAGFWARGGWQFASRV